MISDLTYKSIDSQSLCNIAYFLYLQSAYKKHTRIPTRRELMKRNPEYIIKRNEQNDDKKLGIKRYCLLD
jgi:ribosomal protein L33